MSWLWLAAPGLLVILLVAHYRRQRVARDEFEAFTDYDDDFDDPFVDHEWEPAEPDWRS